MAEELTAGQKAYRARQERLREEGRREARLEQREQSVSQREQRATVSRPAPARRSGPSPDVAVIALTVAGGVIFYDLARSASASGGKLSDQQKLSAALSFGIGGVILLALAESLPELGVPLSLLLLLTVLVGRPQAIEFVSRLAANAQAGQQPKNTGTLRTSFPSVHQSAGSTKP